MVLCRYTNIMNEISPSMKTLHECISNMKIVEIMLLCSRKQIGIFSSKVIQSHKGRYSVHTTEL